MSLEVFWDKLDREVALMAQELLNSRFRSAPKPDVIGDLVCTHLDFGSQSPEIEIIDVTDPFPEFYLPDPHTLADSVQTMSMVDGEESHIYGYDPASTQHDTSLDNELAAYTTSSPMGYHPRHGIGLHHRSISATTNAGMVGNQPLYEENDHYIMGDVTGPSAGVSPHHSFELPIDRWETTMAEEQINEDNNERLLDSSTSYNEETTEPTLAHQQQQSHQHLMIDATSHQQQHHYNSNSNNDYRERSRINHHHTSLRLNNSSGRGNNHDNSKTTTMIGPERRDTDVQIQVRVAYEGNLQLTIATELRLNFPSMAFLSLPIQLTVTSFSFSGTAIIAYLHDRVNFCFLEPEEKGQSLIKDLRVESQIGDARRHVLRNVGKVERFVVDLLRQIVDQDLVFPCYSSVDLVGPEPQHGPEGDDDEEEEEEEEEEEAEDNEVPMEMLAPHPDILLYGHYVESSGEMPRQPLSHTCTPLGILTSPRNGSPIIDPDAVDD